HSGQAGRRLPGARLRRWIELRDRTCRHPCCRAPAATAEVDHRVGWAAGGPTNERNLLAMCRRDHRLKDEAGWAVDQHADGTTVWASPLGHTATAHPPLVVPLMVAPLPRDEQPLSPGGSPYPCGCLLRPCTHDQPTCRTTAQYDATD